MFAGQAPERMERDTAHPALAFLRAHLAVGLIIVALVLVGGYYILAIPLYEVPGEAATLAQTLQHAGLSLPETLLPALPAEGLWPSDAPSRPSLYPILATPLIQRLALPGEGGGYPPNPYAKLGIANAASNRNAVLPLQDELPLQPGLPRMIRALRGISLLCSLFTVLLSYAIAREVAPRQRALAVLSAALVAWTPQFLFVSAGATDAALLIFWSTLLLYLGVCAVNRAAHGGGRPQGSGLGQLYRDYWPPLVLGLVGGILSLQSDVGLLAIPLIPCAWGMSYRKHRPRDAWRQLFRPTLVTLVVMLATCGWWYLRHLPWQSAWGAAGASTNHGGLDALLGRLQEAFAAHWGLFGWRNIRADDLFYTVMGVLSGLGGAGLVILGSRAYWATRTLRNHGSQSALLPFLWALLILAGSAWQVFRGAPANHPWLLPAIAAIALMLSFGLLSWFSRRYQSLMVLCISLLMLGFALIIPMRSILPAYAKPPRLSLERLPDEMQDLDVAYGEELYLVGYRLEGGDVSVGERLHLWLYWLARKRVEQNYVLAVRLYGRGGTHVYSVESHGGGGNYPTGRWLPGEVVVERFDLPIPPDTLVPTKGTLRVSVLAGDAAPPERLPAVDARGNALGYEPVVAQVRLGAAQSQSYRPREPLEADFGIALLTGMDLSPQTPAVGTLWQVTLYWQCQRPSPYDYTVFIHLLDQSGRIVAQVDEQPIHGDYPTSMWRLGEQIRDPHQLSLPDDLPPGSYELRLGLYRLETGERLPIVGSSPPRDDVAVWPILLRGE